MKSIKEWRREKKKEEEILEKAKILNVFFYTSTEEVEVPLDRKENLKLFIESTGTSKEFLGNLFSKLMEINFSRLRKIVIFKKVSENDEDYWTRGRIDHENLDIIDFRINLQDPRYDTEEPEVQIERIKIIYLWCKFLISELQNISESEKIIQQSGILERVTKHFRNDSKIEEVKEELLAWLSINSLEIIALINVPFQNIQEVIEMLKKFVSFKIRSFPSKEGSWLTRLIALGDLALCFEVASFFQDIKLQKKIKRAINRLNNKMLKELFDDFRRVYIEIKESRESKESKESRESREIEKIEEEILIREMPSEYKKTILQKVCQKFQNSQLLKEIEKISDENKEIKKIVGELVKKGAKKEDFEEAYNQIWR